MDMLDTIQRINEAYCVKRGIPVTRRYSDDELADARAELDRAERELGQDNKEIHHD